MSVLAPEDKRDSEVLVLLKPAEKLLLKRICFDRNETMSNVIRQLVLDYINDRSNAADPVD